MAATKSRKNCIVNLKLVVDKFSKSLSLARFSNHKNPEYGQSFSVPEDVKEGHFAVIAIGDGQPKRHIVALSYLTHPAFKRLLEKAAEEYGFDHESALTIPCRSSEVETILAQQWNREMNASDVGWTSSQSMGLVRFYLHCGNWC